MSSFFLKAHLSLSPWDECLHAPQPCMCVHVVRVSLRLCLLITMFCEFYVCKCISVENGASLSPKAGKQKHHHRVTHRLKISPPFLLLLSICTLKETCWNHTKWVCLSKCVYVYIIISGSSTYYNDIYVFQIKTLCFYPVGKLCIYFNFPQMLGFLCIFLYFVIHTTPFCVISTRCCLRVCFDNVFRHPWVQ